MKFFSKKIVYAAVSLVTACSTAAMPAVYADGAAASFVLPVNCDFSEAEIDDRIVVSHSNYKDGSMHERSVVEVADEALAVHIDYADDSSQSSLANTATAQWAARNANYGATMISIPYSGLGDDENLRIEFDWYDCDGAYNSMWGDFGSLVNADGNVCVLGLRGNNSSYGQMDEMTLIGATSSEYTDGDGCVFSHSYTEFGHALGATYGGVYHWKKLTTGDRSKFAYVVDDLGDGNGVKVRYDIERSTNKVTIYYNGVKQSTDLYLLSDLTSGGSLNFCGYAYGKVSDDLVIDNVKMSTWTQFGVESTNLTDAFDVKDDLMITFSNPLGCTANEFKAALTIKAASGSVVDGEDISVTLNDDKTTATISALDGLRYGCIVYTITLDADLICDSFGINLDEDWTGTFTTTLGDNLVVTDSSVVEQSDGSLSVLVSVTNPKTSSLPMWCILAVYDEDNALIGYSFKKEGAVVPGEMEPFTLTAAYDGMANQAKILLLESSKSWLPCQAAVPVDLTSIEE